MTAVGDLREQLGDARMVRVAIPYGCFSPRVAFLAREERTLAQLEVSRAGARRANGTVSWQEDEVAVRVDLVASAAPDPEPAAHEGARIEPAAAATAAPAPTRPVARRRRTSGTLNLSGAETVALEQLIDRALETRPDGIDADLLLAIAAKLERLPHLEAVA